MPCHPISHQTIAVAVVETTDIIIALAEMTARGMGLVLALLDPACA